MYDLAIESFLVNKDEIIPKLEEHWNEIIKPRYHLEMNLFLEMYEFLANKNLLPVFTVRKETELVGYAAFILSQNPKIQDRTLANCEGLWVKKSERNLASVGLKLLDFSEQHLKAAGVNEIVVSHDEGSPKLGKLLLFRNFVPYERVFIKTVN